MVVFVVVDNIDNVVDECMPKKYLLDAIILFSLYGISACVAFAHVPAGHTAYYSYGYGVHWERINQKSNTRQQMIDNTSLI